MASRISRLDAVLGGLSSIAVTLHVVCFRCDMLRCASGSGRMRDLLWYCCALRWNSGLTRQMSVHATEEMSAVESGQMSAVETGQMSAVETRQMFSAETRQMSTGKTGRCPVSLLYMCLVLAEDICPV